MLDDHSELEPPDSIPNSEVKRLSADGSVGFAHVRVGHRQALKYNKKAPSRKRWGFFVVFEINNHYINSDLRVRVARLRLSRLQRFRRDGDVN